MSSEYKREGNTIAHCLNRALILNGTKPFIGQRVGEEFIYESFAQVRTEALSLATGLNLELKIKRRSVVGILGSNSKQWILSKFTCPISYVTRF